MQTLRTSRELRVIGAVAGTGLAAVAGVGLIGDLLLRLTKAVPQGATIMALQVTTHSLLPRLTLIIPSTLLSTEKIHPNDREDSPQFLRTLICFHIYR